MSNSEAAIRIVRFIDPNMEIASTLLLKVGGAIAKPNGGQLPDGWRSELCAWRALECGALQIFSVPLIFDAEVILT